MLARKKVALLVETSNAYARGLLRGINRFQQLYQDWEVFFPEQERGAEPPTWLKDWDCDGLVARIENPKIADFVREFGVPTVDVSSARLIEALPWIETNDEVIGQLGARHLISRGFQHLGYYHDPGFNWSTWRKDSFLREARRCNVSVEVFESSPAYSKKYSWHRDFEDVANWLERLPKPVGVMACYDIKGRQVVEACNRMQIGVPEQVAVLGVDNDPLICESTNPPLTSISLNSFQAGYLAASVLNRLMRNESIDTKSIRIDPLDVVERLSTDTIAIEDSLVAAALRLIRENATKKLRVTDLVSELEVSRRKLECRFKRIVGRTPHQEIQRRRMEQVKRLLRDSNYSIGKIAELTGFDHPEYLSVAFQRETGKKLTEYRRSGKQPVPSEEAGA